MRRSSASISASVMLGYCPLGFLSLLGFGQCWLELARPDEATQPAVSSTDCWVHAKGQPLSAAGTERVAATA
jgi:hypothetical protein